MNVLLYGFQVSTTSRKDKIANLPKHWFSVKLSASIRTNKAFKNFFSGRAKFPRFKKTRDVGIEFKPGTVRIQGNKIQFPKLGWMKFFDSRDITPNWEIRTVTITRDIDDWYVSVLLKDETIPDYHPKPASELQTIVGCDVGIKKIAALSNGEMIPNPKIAQKLERRLRIRQRRLSRWSAVKLRQYCGRVSLRR